MYLRALEIQGFKSFPEKTRLTFERDITAIVGPNGSGKSNISDAIMWVLGEQRTRALRGGKMEDVIFGGTEKRGAMGFAQVSLFIDNSGDEFGTGSGELMITRRYYRSGESEYQINRESVRLRDIHELLMDTGLGRDGYSVIGQGRIAEIVSARNAERRDVFEEAAGISRYRHRKEESERKLARVEENLLRVGDKIDELEQMVLPLREQAETAKRYLILRDELRVLEISLWLENLDRLRERSANTERDFAETSEALARTRSEQEEVYSRSEQLTERMRDRDREIDRIREEQSRLEQERAERDSAAAVLRTNIRNNFESIERLRAERQEQEQRAELRRTQIEERRTHIAGLENRRNAVGEELSEILRGRGENSRRIAEHELEVQKLLSRETELGESLASSRAMVQMLASGDQELMDSETILERERRELRETRSELETENRQGRDALDAVKASLSAQENTIAGYRLRLSSRETRQEQLQNERMSRTVELRAADSRIAMLREMEREYEGFSRSVRTVMQAAGRGELRGVRGTAAELMQTDERYTLALETALGAGISNVIVETTEHARLAIELLRRRNSGRATFLPMSSIRGRHLDREPTGEPGYIGTALSLARFDPEYGGVFASLLGRTAVAETLSHAIAISEKLRQSLRIVTLDGQLINAGGSMTGGSSSHTSGILTRANELRRLESDRARLQTAEEEAGRAVTEALREMEAARYELRLAEAEREELRAAEVNAEAALLRSSERLEQTAKRETALSGEFDAIKSRAESGRERLETERELIAAQESELREIRLRQTGLSELEAERQHSRSELDARAAELSARAAALNAEIEAARFALDENLALLDELSGDADAKTRTLDELGGRDGGWREELLRSELQIEKLGADVEDCRAQIVRLTAERLEFERLRVENERTSQELGRRLLENERAAAALEQKRLAAEMEERQILDRLWENYELSHSAALEIRVEITNHAEDTKRANAKRREIAALGNPNIGAIEEYARVSERYEFLSEQRADIEKSRRELGAIISDITDEMREIFLREFNSIDKSFKETFLELFGGGRAALVLEDEADVLNCGIDIRAQPPGKQLSTISLLSGGEMAFVAIALYFAILKVRPTPFCVMDEIEAALDEANVIRFAEYMRRMSENTQFIVITHRRGTMEEADMLYGVTMKEKGISHILSIDLREAEKTIATIT